MISDYKINIATTFSFSIQTMYSTIVIHSPEIHFEYYHYPDSMEFKIRYSHLGSLGIDLWSVYKYDLNEL